MKQFSNLDSCINIQCNSIMSGLESQTNKPVKKKHSIHTIALRYFAALRTFLNKIKIYY